MQATECLSTPEIDEIDTPAQPNPPSPQPATDPTADALGLLVTLNPRAAAENRARIIAIDTEIGDKIEDARLRLDVPIERFILAVARLMSLRRKLEARIPHLSMDDEAPQRPSVAAEVWATAVRIKRWRDGQALHQEHTRRFIAELGRQIAENEDRLGYLAGGYARGDDLTIRSDTRQYQGGLTGRDDEFLSRAAPLLATRAELSDRLASLIPHDLGWFQEQVRAALGDESAVDALCNALTPAQAVPAQGELARAARAVSETHMSLTQIDPESQRAKALAERLDGLREREQGARSRLQQQQRDAAAALIARALNGTDSGISSLAASCRGIGQVELAERLETIGVTDGVLIATVAEILRKADKPTTCPMCKSPRN
jgi:hypothetical protein